jgi:transcriptional regulator with XRE-family HTH domain
MTGNPDGDTLRANADDDKDAGPLRRRRTGSRPDPVDIHVGARLRQRRALRGLSQEKLAEAVGLTFQQIQKYERGVNRVGASRLHQFGRVLEVPVSYFFDEMPGAAAHAPAAGFAEEKPGFAHDPMARRETLELVRAYYRIGDEKVRRRIFDLVKAIAGPPEGGERG